MLTSAITNAIEIFTNYGCTDVESYSLVNNYGYTFIYNNEKYDARFWRNCYGDDLNRWEISISQDKPEADKKAIKEIETLLNEKCR